MKNNCNECKDPCKKPCVPDCSCPIKLASSCVHYDGNSIPILGVAKGDTLTSIIPKIGTAIANQDPGGGGDYTEPHKNIGSGSQVYKKVNLMGEVELRTILSSDQSVEVTQEEDVIDIKVVQNVYTDLPRYIVNNNYTGTIEEGTYSQPYKSIAAALTAFLGTGTKDAPQNSGATIVVQKGSTYMFSGDLTYRNLNVVLEEGVIIDHNPPVGQWLIDYDTLNNTRSTITIEIRSGASLRLRQKGFRNRGSTGGANSPKRLSLTGSGGEILLQGQKQDGYVLFEANIDNQVGFAMPTFQNFNIGNISVHSSNKDIWNIGTDTAITFAGTFIGHSYKGDTIDIESKTFYQRGGLVTLDGCTISISGGARNKCFILNKPVDKQCRIVMDKCVFPYPDRVGHMFFRESEAGNGHPRVDCQYLSTTGNFELGFVFGINGKEVWRDIHFNYNVIKGGELYELYDGEPTVDLTNNNTDSVTNNISEKEVMELTVHPDRTTATTILGRNCMYICDPDGIPANRYIDITLT